MEQQLCKSNNNNNHNMVEAHRKLVPVHEYHDIVVGSFSPCDSSSSSSSSSSLSTTSSVASLDSDSFEEVTSSPSASSSSSSSADQIADNPLSDMSSLIQQLPIKRGLSMHYQGKSQSFTSLASVRSLEDLAKPENPYNKKLKGSRSFGGGFGESQKSRHVPKRGMHSRGSCSSLMNARRGGASNNSFIMGNRPPIPSHRSTSSSTIPNQTPLFA